MKLKQLRLLHNLTQADVGKLIGKSATGYGYYESGKNEPDLKSLIILADYYHTTIDNLLDHNIPYLLDISTMSDTQKNIINMLKTFDDRQCDKVEAFMVGISGANDIKQMTINKFKGE